MKRFEKLKLLINEADVLIKSRVDSNNLQFREWKTKTELFLEKTYGKESSQCQKFKNRLFVPTLVMGRGDNSFAYIEACIHGIENTKIELQAYLEDEEEKENEKVSNNHVNNTKVLSNKVFVIHGHDSSLKENLVNSLLNQKIEPVILSEQVNQGKTIIEKIESNSDVSVAIALFTNDDSGKAKEDNKYVPRARQNVVFEAGYFMGKIGRDKLIVVAEKEVELPSDLGGVVYIDKDDWKINVFKELNKIGFPIDIDKM